MGCDGLAFNLGGICKREARNATITGKQVSYVNSITSDTEVTGISGSFDSECWFNGFFKF